MPRSAASLVSRRAARLRGRFPRATFLSGSLALMFSCGQPAQEPPPADLAGDVDGGAGACAAAGITPASRFPLGQPDGHRDPLGAKAAGQARAARITDAAWIRQPATARQKVRLGDFLLINDKIAAYIEAPGASDGYQPFGGELLGLEPVDAMGSPSGTSMYGETLLGLSRQAVDAESVTVLADGSDGQAAIVRVSGRLRNIPFLDTFAALSAAEFDFPIALDYVLAPGAEKITLRMSLMNLQDQALELEKYQFIGFFHESRNQLFFPGTGFASPPGEAPWIGFVNDGASFAYRPASGLLDFIINVSGFDLLRGRGLTIDPCAKKTVEYGEFIVAGAGVDSLQEVVRRTEGAASATVAGKVLRADGAAVPDAWVHASDTQGAYLTRVRTNAAGEFLLHVPATATKVRLVPTVAGADLAAPVEVAAGVTSADLRLPAPGLLEVHAVDDKAGTGLPVRIQVIPKTAVQATPPAYGVSDEARGRLHQIFAMDGTATVPVPPGEHRVIVSRGYEWELSDQSVTVTAGRTARVDVRLEHSVDTTGVLCADFHIHSYYSADSSDDVELKVKSAIADGLDIPVSSEHEWIIDFQPIVQRLGLTRWAFGMPSEEFTTFTWGHFGIIPIRPRPDAINNGAVPWIGMKPPMVFRSIAELPERPVLIVNHPSGGDFGSYFSAAGFQRDTATGVPELWSDQFGAVEVFNDSDLESNRNKSAADWFALLNAGKKVWAVGSSDSHGLRTSPVGYPRTCLTFGHDDTSKLTPEAVRDALAAGAATVSGGLYMTVTGPSGVGPGGNVPTAGAPLPFQLTVQAPHWLSAARVEAIVDGETVGTQELRETVTGSTARRYEATFMIAGKPGRTQHWVVFHASAGSVDLSPLHPGRKPFAVSNPIFF